MGSVEAEIVFIILILLLVHSFLSRREECYWGAILPLFFLNWWTRQMVTGQIDDLFFYGFILLIGLCFLIAQWQEGREVARRRRKKKWDKGTIFISRKKSFSLEISRNKEQTKRNWNEIRD